MDRIIHPIPPFINQGSKVLILGSFPSVKSRESGFYYGHPQNRFWKLLAALLEKEAPRSIADKKRFLSSHGIALWDMVQSCRIAGSSDASISELVCNDIRALLGRYPVQAVLLNGKTAGRLYGKHVSDGFGIPALTLPSTSPANAAYGMDRLLADWRVLLDHI